MTDFLPTSERDRFTRAQWWALCAGAVALVPCLVGWVLAPAQFFRAYLAAYQFYLGLGLGCMVVLMIYHLTGGAWGFLVRRILEAGARTVPLLAVLFVPIACGLPFLYIWARPAAVAASKSLQHKEIYLNDTFFWCRAALYFVLWSGLSFLLSSWSRRQDETGDPRWAIRLGLLSGPGLIIYGITLTFACVDWVMSLVPTFHSTIFGPLFAAGHLVSAFAFTVVILAVLVDRPPYKDIVSLEALNDTGSLLFAFLIVWGYMVFFQFVLIWIANLRYEVEWLLARSEGAWLWMTYALVLFGFAIPFFLLLSRDLKRHPPTLAKVAGLILFTHLAFSYYQVMPAFPGTTIAEHWMDFLMPIGLGGLWLAYFLFEVRQRPILANHDLNRQTAAHFHHLNEEAEARERELQHA